MLSTEQKVEAVSRLVLQSVAKHAPNRTVTSTDAKECVDVVRFFMDVWDTVLPILITDLLEKLEDAKLETVAKGVSNANH